MRKEGKRRQRSKKERNKQTTLLPMLAVGIAISGIAVVLGYHGMQAQKRLERMERKLELVSEDGRRAKANVVELGKVATEQRQALKRVDADRNGLQSHLQTASAKIKRLTEIVERAELWRREWQIRFESLETELASTKKAADQAKAEAATLRDQIISLNARLEETNAERRALLGRLELARSDAKQLRDQLNTAQTELLDLRSRLKAKLSELGVQSKLKREAQDRDYLIRTLVFEASGETEIGKAAVAHVILNRLRSGGWGDKIQDVVTSPGQFEPWTTRKRELKELSPNDPDYRKAAEIVDGVLAGLILDPTAGATYFLNPILVRQRNGDALPSWAHGEGEPIGRHVFYSAKGNKASQQRAEAQGMQPSSSLRHLAELPGAGW
jgi:hypothetical protein